MRRGGGFGHTQYVSSKCIRAKVLSVDRVKWVATVQGENNEMIEGVAVMPSRISADGGGSYWLPETNSVVWLMYPSSESTPFILGGASLPKQTDEGDDAEDPNDHRMNRPVINEGDHVLAQEGSAFVILRKGGIVEIGASQTCRRFYIPLQNIIHEFSENLITEGSWGKTQFLTRREDESHGEGRSPVEFRMQIRDFAEDAPIIDVGLGRIAEEDTESVFQGAVGQIVARFLINNRFRVWIDKDGNSQVYRHGTTTSSYNDARIDYHEKTFLQRVKGLFREELGSHYCAVRGNQTVEVAGNQSVQVTGSQTETVDGSVTRSTGPVVETVAGGITRILSGGLEEKATNVKTVASGGHTLEAGSSVETISGTKQITVSNASFSGTAYEVVVANGEIHLHNVLGKTILACGPTVDLAPSRIVAKINGTVEISTNLGLIKIEQNASGVQIKTAAGEVSLDNAGTVLLGPPGRGCVVTTLTHPIDFVTGAPIFGTASVQAGGFPSLIGLPSTFVPDPT